jgi:hypothetical protein
MRIKMIIEVLLKLEKILKVQIFCLTSYNYNLIKCFINKTMYFL